MTHTIANSFTRSGTADKLYDAVDWAQLVSPPNYEGDVTISYDFDETIVTVDSDGVVQSVGDAALPTEDFTFPVWPYDDGAYRVTLENLKILDGGSSSQSSPSGVSAQDAGMVTTLDPPTGVRAGIDWSTLTWVRRQVALSTNETGKSYEESGSVWRVQTVQGNTVTLFEADPYDQQPAATRALPRAIAP